ncbi:hypothetical protein DFH28DRAFT_1126534 [Melampsora americana]|nr:hypothetical protein DFH28DRAFT_1126534 [Melampsora americana]
MPNRSGLRSNNNDNKLFRPDSELNDPSSDSQENEKAIAPSRGQNRQARRGGHTGSQAGRPKRRRITHPTESTPPIPSNDEIADDDDALLDKADNTTPTLENFHEVGLRWGRARAEQYLSNLTLPKNNRPSAIGIYEGQALQASYNLDKTMLCIVLKCSQHTLDEALLEGPLAREPNMYTNYQTYSVVATTTQMPPKGVSEGFKDRNVTVGKTWSSYTKEEQEIFNPRLFEPLCIATSEAYALTQTPHGIPNSHPDHDIPQLPHKPQVEALSMEEVTLYRPIFERLVNLKKVSGDLHEGRLRRHSGKSRSTTREQLLKLEISKVVRQLHVLNSQLNLQFHLLLASWNPDSPTTRALFQDEHTSCERWARAQKKKHLLECFSFDSTRAPDYLRPTPDQRKPISEAAARQAAKRTELTRSLNNLIAPFLRGGFMGQGDAHPKVSNMKQAFDKKTFRGKIKLTFNRTPDSLVTDEMLTKGPTKLTNDEVQLWLDDIDSKRYTLIKVPGKQAPKREDQLTAEEPELDNSFLNEDTQDHQDDIALGDQRGEGAP